MKKKEVKPQNIEAERLANEYVRLLDTQGYKKMWNYFIDISKTIEFQSEIVQLRKKINVPKELYKDENLKSPPDGWIYSHKAWNTLHKYIHKICRKYGLHSLYWGNIIEGIVFYDKFEKLFDYGFDVCLFSDLVEEIEEPFMPSTQEADLYNFPLAIRISPYANY